VNGQQVAQCKQQRHADHSRSKDTSSVAQMRAIGVLRGEHHQGKRFAPRQLSLIEDNLECLKADGACGCVSEAFQRGLERVQSLPEREPALIGRANERVAHTRVASKQLMSAIDTWHQISEP
jgi:hypothetical protein